jgi:thiamine monophosphate kinase
VPVAPGATTEDALTSGEEVELVCVGPEEKVRDAGLSAFGVMTAEKSVRVLDARGADLELAARGYDHFA